MSNPTGTSRSFRSFADVNLSRDDLDFFRKFAHTHIGIHVAQYKKSLVLNRVLKRMRALNIQDVSEYRNMLNMPGNLAEVQHLVNALTTNKTSFFREPHHFDHLTKSALPQLIADRTVQQNRRLRIWSAGCSTGEEAYTAAMTVRDSGIRLNGWNYRILATDVDTDVVAAARQATYDAAAVAALPTQYRHHLVPVKGYDTLYEIEQSLRSDVVCKPLNLFSSWPMAGPMHVVFCRNVVIYFDTASQTELLDRIADILVDGGFLYAGHSESISRVSTRFRSLGQSIYQKLA